MTATLPGFFADRSLTAERGGNHRVAHVATTIPFGVRPAQDDQPCRTSRTSGACQACWSACISGCDNPRDCFPVCRGECGGQPRDPGPVTGGGGPAPPLIRYGNYCGPGWGDPTGATPPIDAVDAVCRTHDLCYAATTYFNCGCDRALLLAMPAAISATPSPLGAAAGAAAIAHFAGAPCTCCLPVFPPFPFPCVPLPAGIGGVGPC
jgi:hypothetical protein